MTERKEMETSTEAVTIDDLINAHMCSMTEDGLGYEAYHQMIMDLDRLTATKERVAPAKRPLSKDAILGAIASVGTVIVIVTAEHVAPQLSKAFSFVPKLFR